MNLNIFNTNNLFEAATDLFRQLNIKLNSNTAEPLPVKDILKHHYKDNDTFKAIDKTYFIGIIDDSIFEETGLFDINYSYKEAIEQGDRNYNGLMLFSLELKKQPTRTEISELTRAFNRVSQKMPVALVLKYTVDKVAVISISISERFKYLQNWRQGEKAGKVIILRDIHTQNTHAGHIRILQDLVKPVGVTTYEQLHQHWLQVLDVSILNKKFFQDLSNWYFSAMNEVSFPDDLEKKKEVRNATNLIRLITRVIFIWFIKEKQLVPASLFRKDFLSRILKDFNKNKKSQNYYNAILQNLFFGTLNQKMEERKFAKEGDIKTNKEEYGVKNLFRYADLFTIPEKDVLELFKDIPFLNGGLFDCLDKPNDEGKIEYVDGFSRNPKKRASVPDFIFFGEEKEVDLNEVYGTKNKRYRSKGLINLLDSYKFTVAENTPLEEEIALDPELLGKVFENLLASYNPETQTTARKQTGSFYTPREIVNYMVDESLLEYLKQSVVSIPAHEKQTTLSIPDHELNQKQDAFETFETFFNPYNEIQIHFGNLPHWQQENVWYFVTFRLADSIPADVVEQIKAERELWLKKNKKNEKGEFSLEQKKEYYRLFSERTEQLLNSGKGSCVLKNSGIAKIVADALEHFNNERYVLDEWVIMPNHVHILFKTLGDNKLPDILHSWKSYTANEINKVTGNKGQVWMHESYDHIVRNEKALKAIRNYIWQNPVKANLKEGEYLLSRSRDASVTLIGNKDASVTLTGSKEASETFEERLRNLFSYEKEGNPFNETETKALIEAINNCKILDPACGSGAFPMGILHKMVHILQKLDPENKHWKELQRKKAIEETEAAFRIGDKEERAKRLAEINDVFENNSSDYGRKLYLIENCIYGIDIQPIAVQIAKLRFFISLVIDQNVHPSSLMDGKQKENRGIRPLPNLETKFVVANTLIGLDKPQQTHLRNPDIEVKENELKELRHKYFTANTRKEKIALQKQDKKLRLEIAKMLESDGWDNQVAQQISFFDPYDQNHFANWFDPEWMFGLTEGFDIVIGNPPYVQLQKDGGKLAKEFEKQNYKTFARTGDIYTLFYEKGVHLLRNNGVLTYITSNKWMRAGYGEKLREFFTNYNPKLLIDLGPGIFESATVDTNILLLEKAPNQCQLKALTLQKSNLAISEQVATQAVTMSKLSKDAWFIGSAAEQQLKEKIERIGKPLKDWDVKIYRGVLTGLNEAFIIDSAKREEILNNCKDEEERKRTQAIIKPILRGRDIKRYTYEWAGLWVIGTFPALKLNIEDYPAIKKYLLDNFDIRQLEQSGKKYPELGFDARKKTGNKWFETQDQIAYYPEFEKEKVVFKAVGRNLTFSLLERGKYLSAPASFMTSSFNKYILGFLCSTFTKYFVEQNADKTGAGDIMLNIQSFEKIPLPPITLENQPIVSRIEQLVEQILAAKNQNPQSDTTSLELEIDELVYKLYDLTEEEIGIVEEGNINLV